MISQSKDDCFLSAEAIISNQYKQYIAIISNKTEMKKTANVRTPEGSRYKHDKMSYI